MPALIAEAKRAEKRTNMEYAAHSGNCSSNSNGRENSNDNKRQNTKHSNSNSNCNNGNHSQSANCSCPKKQNTAKVNNAETATHYESDPTVSDLKGLKTECQNRRLDPPARFQPSGFVTHKPITQSPKARLGSQLELPKPTT
ncbi:hypothetical protein DSO57_1021270 [Entomophthora muscae]|uniref:Uncharacterized protein n=1 Tax=Entomophthora muscae TaxID=34485 RepID=A0ACC2S5M1_9FUNG|nr:hypothetical protein DSO57_1021270 [Entomophthora muscae]